MKIKYVELFHSNPSLGPYEKKTTITLFANAAHSQKIDEYIERSTVFDGKMPLREFIIGTINKDAKVLSKIQQGRQSVDSNRLNQGQTISDLKFVLEDGHTATLNDLRYYSFSGYSNGFIEYIAKNGSVDTSSRSTDIERLLKEEKSPSDD